MMRKEDIGRLVIGNLDNIINHGSQCLGGKGINQVFGKDLSNRLLGAMDTDCIEQEEDLPSGQGGKEVRAIVFYLENVSNALARLLRETFILLDKTHLWLRDNP